MTALTPHIRVLRAESEALAQQASMYNRVPVPPVYSLLIGMADAKRYAADQLEAEEAALKPPREDVDKPITHNPKGKPRA